MVLDVGGELRVWDEPLDSERRRRWYEDRYLPTLEALLDHDVERVLVTHGEPVLQGGPQGAGGGVREAAVAAGEGWGLRASACCGRSPTPTCR